MTCEAANGTAHPTDDAPVRLRVAGLSSREIGGELVVLDLDSSRYLSVGGSGTVLFELLRTPRHRAELVTALRERFDVDEATARRDVDQFLTELGNAGLLDTA
jgi:hypothetical protein